MCVMYDCRIVMWVHGLWTRIRVYIVQHERCRWMLSPLRTNSHVHIHTIFAIHLNWAHLDWSESKPDIRHSHLLIGYTLSLMRDQSKLRKSLFCSIMYSKRNLNNIVENIECQLRLLNCQLRSNVITADNFRRFFAVNSVWILWSLNCFIGNYIPYRSHQSSPMFDYNNFGTIDKENFQAEILS